ncbi:hypothetical protein H8356DRAFT_1359205 [Neocallimastix lanati (nom. inval.)]|nr:hypothetical protein H8356DRAFT_1359205 [Neocallimastix sp. JGI-2020a]
MCRRQFDFYEKFYASENKRVEFIEAHLVQVIRFPTTDSGNPPVRTFRRPCSSVGKEELVGFRTSEKDYRKLLHKRKRNSADNEHRKKKRFKSYKGHLFSRNGNNNETNNKFKDNKSNML